MNIAFVLLTYLPDEPAGIERSVAALAVGLQALGHRAVVITAAAGAKAATDPHGELRVLTSLELPRPAREDELLAVLRGRADDVEAEVHTLLRAADIELVCWVDAVWGLGYLAPAPSGMPMVLMVHVPRSDPLMRQALARQPDRIIAPSQYVLDACDDGFPTGSWMVVPNGLLRAAAAPAPTIREQLRRHGPVGVIARAEPHKGIAPLIQATPVTLDRRADIVLAPAGFEYWPGMQEEVFATCRQLAADRPQIQLRDPLPWDAAQPFLATACCTIIASTSAETFGLVALEAMSVGTPVVAFDIGNIPPLAGPAASLVAPADGAPGLWRATRDLLNDPTLYRARSQAGITRAAAYTPSAAATAFLKAAGLNADTIGETP
jgi:iron(II)-dependent oxidoreductase